MVGKWRKAQRLLFSLLPPRDPIPGHVELADAVVEVRFLLLSNPLWAKVVGGDTADFAVDTDTLTLAPHEGVFNLVSMRQWLPTAAYAAEMAHRVRRMFSVGGEEVEE